MTRATDQPGPEPRRLARLYATTRRLVHTSIRSTTREALLQSVCDALVEVGGWTVAWVAWHDVSARLLRPVAHRGAHAGRLCVALRVDADGDQPSLVALRTRAAVPIVHGDAVVGTITVCSDGPGAFTVPRDGGVQAVRNPAT